jgi:hypothetical protein
LSLKPEKENIDEKAKVKASDESKSKVFKFPRNSLNTALRVPEIIWEENAGEPFSLFDIASKLGSTPTSGSFRDIITSSVRYGLTNEGISTKDFTKTISLTPLGKSIVAPTPDENVNSLKRKALETPEIFQKALNLLNAKIIPEATVFKNMLIRNFNMDKQDAESCHQVLMENINELGATENFQGKVYLRLDKVGAAEKTIVKLKESEPDEDLETQKDTNIETHPAPPCQTKFPWVFISHSKNKKILDQIKQVLAFGTFKYEIAEDRETLAIPLSDKVFSLMRKCNCAIINISADEEKKQGETYGINENVLIEIGGSFLHYDKRVILVIDRKFKDVLPSILQGLTAIFYEGDALSWEDGMRLQKALTAFRSTL